MAGLNLDKVKFGGFIKNGELFLDNPARFKKFIQQYNDCQVIVNVQKFKKQRSNAQNNWYWGCVVAIPAEHIGYTSEEMHEAYKFMFLRRKNVGKPITVKSTASLSTVEFSKYVENCRMWCAENGYIIPDPDEWS